MACKADITPRNGFPGATSSAMSVPGLRRKSTIGRLLDVSSSASSGVISQSARAAQRSATITPNGFSYPALSARNRATVASVACQAREMIAAQTFHRGDRSSSQSLS